MSKELVISANRHETKVAILEDDQLVEIYFQHSNEYSLAGSIHKGRVTRVLPGMQSAFVDLGLERDTFLYVSDFFEENEEYDRILPTKDEKQGRPERADRPERFDRPQRAERADHAVQEAPDEHAPVEAEAHLEAEPLPPGLEGSEEVFAASPFVEKPVEPPAAHGSERAEHSGDRDQRGRRSRRRRNRGRGFPDSKYSSDVNAPALKTPEREPEREPEPEPAIVAPAPSDYEFSVLPGESLAKYRRAPGESDDEEGTAVPEPEIRAQVHEEDLAPMEHFSGGAGAAVAREPEQIASEPAIHESPVSEPPSQTELEAEAASDIIEEARENAAFSLEDVADSPQPALETIQFEEELPLVAGEEVLEGEDESPDEPGGEPVAEPSAEATAPGAEAASLTANVREQGSRYMHRMPRRMRRKMRGGPGAEEGPGASSTGPAHRPEMHRNEPQRSEHQRTEHPRSEHPRSEVRAESPRTEIRTAPRPEKAGIPSITELLKEGQEIIVQIAKEPLGQKGARITSHIALPGRYVVYMPTLEHMGVSRKIASDEERLRLKKILLTHRVGVQGGFIVRTAGEGKTEEDIAADMNFLSNLWLDMRQKAEKRPAPLLLHHDLDIVQRILRDQVTDSFKSIWVDDETTYESILRFVQRFQPAMVTRVKMYTRPAPIFDAFNITPELEKALRPKVWLKSGGYIVINQTEALVAVDVNTGKYVGKSNRLEDTIVRTNTDAVKEIVRQIRLRDLGGIIVVDFIDMDERKNRQKVMQALEEAMRVDKAPYKILQFNDFGLVAITRKRVKQSLERALCSPCPYCEGAGYVKSVQTTVGDILQEAHKIARAVEGENVILRVHPEVAKFLKSHHNKYLEELEEILRRPVLVKGDPLLHQDKFDLA